MAVAVVEDKAAKVLGIEASGGPMAWVHAAEKGLPVSKLDVVAKTLAPENSGFKFQIVSKATYARRQKAKPARLSRDESERLMRIVQVLAFAEQVWGGSEAALRFLKAPHALLENETPLDVSIQSEIGAKLVTNILGRLAHGTAV